MISPRLTRRAVLGALAGLAPALAFAQPRPRFGGVAVDVSPLRRSGDAMDAEFFAQELPGLLRQHFAPYLGRGAPPLVVRVDSVQYGAVGGATLPGSDGAVDYVEATGIVGGSQYPMFASMVTRVDLNDRTGEAGRTRMRNLAEAVAQWLPGKMGLY